MVVRLIGGLGNQLFQYAVGRAMAIRNNSTLALDRRLLDRSGTRYGLHHFNIEHAVVAGGKLPPEKKSQRMRYFLWRKLNLAPRLLQEEGLGFNPRVVQSITNVYLTGYWQSERYFADVACQIREDFRIVTSPDSTNAALLREIGSRPAISVHVRRGDYLIPHVQAFHGGCSKEYYVNAVKLIAARTGQEPVVYAFSDDPDWVREHLVLPFEMQVVSNNGPETNYEDLRLMSACRHHVIANSSFSWWGAWLNPSADKVVVAPKNWFADPSASNPDIAPESWHRLDN